MDFERKKTINPTEQAEQVILYNLRNYYNCPTLGLDLAPVDISLTQLTRSPEKKEHIMRNLGFMGWDFKKDPTQELESRIRCLVEQLGTTKNPNKQLQPTPEAAFEALKELYDQDIELRDPAYLFKRSTKFAKKSFQDQARELVVRSIEVGKDASEIKGILSDFEKDLGYGDSIKDYIKRGAAGNISTEETLKNFLKKNNFAPQYEKWFNSHDRKTAQEHLKSWTAFTDTDFSEDSKDSEESKHLFILCQAMVQNRMPPFHERQDPGWKMKLSIDSSGVGSPITSKVLGVLENIRLLSDIKATVDSIAGELERYSTKEGDTESNKIVAALEYVKSKPRETLKKAGDVAKAANKDMLYEAVLNRICLPHKFPMEDGQTLLSYFRKLDQYENDPYNNRSAPLNFEHKILVLRSKVGSCTDEVASGKLAIEEMRVFADHCKRKQLSPSHFISAYSKKPINPVRETIARIAFKVGLLRLSLACLDPKDKKGVPESVAREIALMTLGLPSGVSVDDVKNKFGTLFQHAQNPTVVLRAFEELLGPDTVGCNKPIVPEASSSLVHSAKEQRVVLDTTQTTTQVQQEKPDETGPHL